VIRVRCSDTASNNHSKRHDGPVERHVDDETSARPNVTNLPADRLLPRKEGRSPRATGEWAIELKLSRRIVPVIDIGPPDPGERRTDLGFNGMLKLAGDVLHDGDGRVARPFSFAPTDPSMRLSRTRLLPR